MIQNGPVRINISLPPMSAGELFARLGFSLEGLGPAWVAIISDLLRQLEKERTGAYQAPYSFSESAESY